MTTSARARVFAGSCHCGAIGFSLQTSRNPDVWPVRACQCSFCRRHGARTTSDPAGSVVFRAADERSVQRYRFGLRTADFLVCRKCGVYLAAMVVTPRGRFATLNINALDESLRVPEAASVSYEAESAEQRLHRREQSWTPVSDGA